MLRIRIRGRELHGDTTSVGATILWYPEHDFGANYFPAVFVIPTRFGKSFRKWSENVNPVFLAEDLKALKIGRGGFSQDAFRGRHSHLEHHTNEPNVSAWHYMGEK